jgi:hypothetical protein
MTPAPAQLAFVSSLFASKIFWVQVVTLVAMILSAAGVHILDAPGAQEQAIGILDALATMALRWLAPTGPVAIGAPFSTPANQDVPVGASVVHVAAPTEALQVTAVQPIAVGTHTVTVAPPVLPDALTPAAVMVRKA